MKKALFIIGGLAAAAFGGWAIYRYVVVPGQKIKVTNIDWENRAVSYETPLQSGTVSFEELLAVPEYLVEDGDSRFSMYAGSDAIVLSFHEGLDKRGNPKMVARRTVDFIHNRVLDFGPKVAAQELQPATAEGESQS